VAALVFLGTPEAAVPSLRALVEAGHDVRLVVTQPDRRRGRGGVLMPSPVKQAALGYGLPVTEELSKAADVGAELGVVVAYGRLVPPALLAEVPMVNVHFSLLPRWRGAAPVERAILAGDTTTGVSLMRLEAGLDTGPVLAETVVEIGPAETAPELTGRLAELGARLLIEQLAYGADALGPGRPQVGEPTYATKLEPDELRLRWGEPADMVVRRVRLGRAHTWFRGERLLVRRAAVGDVDAVGGERPDAETTDAAVAPGAPLPPGTLLPVARVVAGDGRLVVLHEVQPPGRRPMPADAWWQGARVEAGARFDDGPGR